MARAHYFQLTDFSEGQNNAFDPRSLRPYTTEDNAMEAQRIENYEITELGALLTSPGFEEVVSTGFGGEGTYVGSYDYDRNNRYLIAVANDRIGYKRKYTNTIIHDCDAFDSGTYGTFVASGDFDTPTTVTSGYQRGSGMIASNMSSGSPTGQGKLTVSLTSVDVSTHTSIEMLVNLSSLDDLSLNPDIFTNMKFRLGTDSSNYFEWTKTQNANSNAPVVGWNGFVLTAASPTTTVGSPDLSALTFFELEYNFKTDAAAFTLQLDDIRAVTSSTVDTMVEITNGLWQSIAVEPTLISGLNFSSSAFPFHLISHNGQQGVKVRQVGPGMLISEANASAPVRTHITADMTGFLFVGKNRTLSHGAAQEEDDFGGGGVIGYTSEIIGLAPTADKRLLVQLRDGRTEAVDFSFDDTNFIYTPVKSDYQNGVGGVSHKSIQTRYNDSISLSTEGVAFFGESEQIASGNYRAASLSWPVDKLMRQVNDNYSESSASYYDITKKQYGVAMPIGTGANRPNKIFVWNSQYDSWSFRSGITMNHATQHREDEDYEIYFVSPRSDSIYKFSSDYNYDGEAYKRHYSSKIFTMGARALFKDVEFIEVSGSMPKGSEFFVVAKSDNLQKAFKVTDTSLLTDSEGGYIGDETIGDEYFGGDGSGMTFFRFVQRIELPRDIREGREFQFDFYNETAGMPHKIDGFNIKFTYGPEAKVPPKHINDNIDPTVKL